MMLGDSQDRFRPTASVAKCSSQRQKCSNIKDRVEKTPIILIKRYIFLSIYSLFCNFYEYFKQ